MYVQTNLSHFIKYDQSYVVVLVVPDLYKQKQTYLALQQYTCAR